MRSVFLSGRNQHIRQRIFPSLRSVRFLRSTGSRTSFSAGEYNLYNALACISFLSEHGVSAKDIAAVLPEFSGIERRFDIHRKDGRYLVIDDYAHNPHKIYNLMEAMKKISGSVCYIFQPHGYGPTRLMKEGYIKTLQRDCGGRTILCFLPIYYAGGTAAKDISSRDLAEGIAASGRAVEVIGTVPMS